MADPIPDLSAAQPQSDAISDVINSLASGTAVPTQAPPPAAPAAPPAGGNGGNNPPQPGLPNILQFVKSMVDPNRSLNSMGRPQSRAGAFEDFLGNFMQSMSAGMSVAPGPGANVRAAGAAMAAPYENAVNRFKLQEQANANQADINQRNAQAEVLRRNAELTPVTLPGGTTVQVPAGKVSDVLKGVLGYRGKVDTAAINKRFVTTPAGLFDTQEQKLIQDTGSGIMVTPEIADQYNLPKEFIGKPMKLTDLSSVEKGNAANFTIAQGKNGPAIVNKSLAASSGGTQGVSDLKLGNPRATADAIAQGRLSLAQKAFERDTFGTLYGKDIPSSLVDASGNTLGWKSPAMPTSNIKTQAQQAKDLTNIFDEVTDEIKQAQKDGKLGPVSGRLNEIMTGKVGADDPEFAKLRALGSLTASGMLKAHFGARGGQQMYGHFEDLFNTGKMTAGDLLGAMDGFKVFMNNYAGRVKTVRDKNAAPKATHRFNPTTGKIEAIP
jgi:hypothetical protein